MIEFTAMTVLALDLSLTNTGWAISLSVHGNETAPGTLRGVERLAAWREWLNATIYDHAPELAVLEGYSFGSNNAGARGIAEWGGVARLTLFDQGIPFVEVPPAVLKKFGSGRGNATKSDMRIAMYKRSGLDVADDNACDALWLLAAAHEAFADPLWPMPKDQVAVLEKVTWSNL